MKTLIPRLTIVGAGPGDPELITLKAIKAIQSADVILYDALINKDFLDYASKHTELIYVGKRKGCYSYQQEQINELIVQRAKTKGHVVRLKGGDPFVFGRGAEEIDYVKPFGIETYVVPGISSALAVPAFQGIPLTKTLPEPTALTIPEQCATSASPILVAAGIVYLLNHNRHPSYYKLLSMYY